MAEPQSKGRRGEVRCFGCGQEPQAGVIERLADGTNCPSCAGRVLEEQPSLLRPRTAAPSPFEATRTSEVEAYMADAGEQSSTAGESQAELAPLAPGRHLRHLPGGTAPDMRAAPDGHWPNEPA